MEPPPTPRMVAGGPASGIQEITRRLQEERDALRTTVEELTRQLNAERSARANVEHELQVKELEILHEQQRSRQAKQALQEKVMQLEKELDDEKAMHQMTMMGRTVAADKNSALAAELKEIEARVKKEIAKRDTLSGEMDLLREEMQMLMLERDAIMKRTEADARRVRELWDQIIREHDTQAEAYHAEVEMAREAKETVEQSLVEVQAQVVQLEGTVRLLTDEKKVLEGRVAAFSNEKDSMKSSLERERERERDAGQHKSQLLVELQDLRGRCVLLEEREKIVMKEKQIAEEARAKTESELEARTEELLAIKTEFSDLLDKHERYAEEFKHQTRHREDQTQVKLRQLQRRQKFAEEIAGLRKQVITEHKQVMRSVNRRLNEVREKQQSMSDNQQASHVRPTRTSVSILRH